MTTKKSSGHGKSPFLPKWDWAWPADLLVELDESTAVVSSEKPGPHPPDLRALTILEAADEHPEVLALGGPVKTVRVLLGRGWREAKAGALIRRLGLLSPNLRSRVAVVFKGNPVPLADAFAGALNPSGPLTAGQERVLGDDLRLLELGLSRWLELVDTYLAAGEPDVHPVPGVWLEPKNGRAHPRLKWLVAQFLQGGVRVEAPDRPLRVVQSGFVEKLTTAVVDHKRRTLGSEEPGEYRGNKYDHILPGKDWRLAVWEPLRNNLVRDLGGRRHPAFPNLKSSQAFAVNVLRGLDQEGLLPAAVANALGYAPDRITKATLVFEFCPPELKKFLGEDKGPHQTQVDAVVRLDLADGSKEAILFEVKLTETAFGTCGGSRSNENVGRDACEGASHDRATRCYLTGIGRTYWQHQDAFAELVTALGTGPCPLRDDGYQLARNLVIRRWIEGGLGEPGVPAKLRVDRARFAVLCVSETPALASSGVRKLDVVGGRVALSKAGVEWVDARRFVADVALAGSPLLKYLQDRYGPVWAEDDRRVATGAAVRLPVA